MDKKIPKGIIIFGILFIVGLFTGISDKIFIAFPKSILTIIDWALRVIAVVGLFATVGLFTKKEIARKVTMAIVSIHTIFPILQIPFINLNWIIQTGSKGSLIEPGDLVEARPFAIGSLIFIFVTKILWCVVFLYYLSRPKIREQFK